MSTEAATLPNATRLLAGLRPLLLLVGVAAAVAAGVTVVLWSQGPTYTLLYANLAMEDTAQITKALEAAQIPYRMDASSTSISVPADQLADARLKLAAQGLPEAGGGIAALTKDPGFGLSQFMEGARYQHALETELARTIAAMRPVEGARVHLAVPRQSAFVRDRRPGSASVFVQLRAGRRLEQEQVQSIINLVASSVPELEASQVTVVDQQGRLLSAPQGSGEFAERERQMEAAQKMESEYTQRIESLLAPLVGAGRVRAQVVAQVDLSTVEEAREQYNPQNQVVRSEQTSEEVRRDAAGASGGVPGALSNQPPAAGVAAPPAGAPRPGAAAQPAGAGDAAATADASAAQPGSTSRQATRNFEIDRTIAYTRQPAGRLKRLTVAVLVDNVRTVDKSGKVTAAPFSAQQLERMTQLVKDAVGFDAARGDSVNVVNAPFSGETLDSAGELETVPPWQQPFVLDAAKILSGLIVLVVLALTVLRPLVRNLTGPARPTLPGPGGVGALPAAAGELMPNAAGGAAVPAATARMAGAADAIQYEQQLAQARSMVSQDPKRVAQVVRTWVNAEE